jgi:hypothetical protein
MSSDAVLPHRPGKAKFSQASTLAVDPFGDLGALLGHPLNDELFVATVGGLSIVRFGQSIVKKTMLESCELLEGEMALPLETDRGGRGFTRRSRPFAAFSEVLRLRQPHGYQ